MKLVTFQPADADGAQTRLGVVVDSGIVDLTAAWRIGGATEAPRSVRELIDLGPGPWEALRAEASRGFTDRPVVPSGDVRLLAPVGVPPKLICAGLNYRTLAERVRFTPGEGAPVFLKATSTISGPKAPVVLPAGDMGPVLAEVELGVVIGSTGKDVPVDAALDLVFGYTTVIDVTAQQMMERDAYTFRPPGAVEDIRHIVMFRSKHHDTFTPIGPSIVTADELDAISLASLRIDADVDGEPIVRGNTEDMLIDVPHLISYVSSVMTLCAGDVIATGHPGNVVDRPLAAGQIIRARIGEFDELTVPVEARTRAPRAERTPAAAGARR